MIQATHPVDSRFTEVEAALRKRIQFEEAEHGKNGMPPNSLWEHVSRVASIAERIGIAEGVDPTVCRLAGLFHDAGKFKGGEYHQCDELEEYWSVASLKEITRNMGFESSEIDQVEQAILQLYGDDSATNPLTRILFDADNLDKLGFLGVANFFIKAGLRGKGISPSFLYRITVELTYARHAPSCLATETGRQLAAQQAPETISYFKTLIQALREAGIYDFQISEVLYDNIIIDVVSPSSCNCGTELARKIWGNPGLKCSEIHLQHLCTNCGSCHKLHFCRPRLIR